MEDLAYILVLKLLFKNVELWIWAVYLPPNNHSVREELLNTLSENWDAPLYDHSNTEVLHILLGDFNETMDNLIDRLPPNNNLSSDFILKLQSLGMDDVCRLVYLDEPIFTHRQSTHNSTASQSCIDHIWISTTDKMALITFENHSTMDITNSHHNIISTRLDVSDAIRNNFQGTCITKQLDPPKKKIDYDKITHRFGNSSIRC